LAALLLAAGCENLPVILPPGFGPAGSPTAGNSFFFPTGLAVLPDGTVLVANGNFGHAYEGGTVVSLRSDFLHDRFARTSAPADGGAAVDCSQPSGFLDGGLPGSQDAGIVAQFPADCDVFPDAGDFQSAFASSVMIGNYAGQIGLDDAASDPARFAAGGGTAYVGSRDTNTLDAIHVGPGGTLTCAADAGTGQDCRAGLFNTDKAGNLDGPFAITSGDAAPPGQPSRRVMFVASLVPHVEFIQDSVPITSSEVSVIDMANPAQGPIFTILGSSEFVAAGLGIGPILYDGARRRIVASGCYQRFPNSGVSDLATSKCLNINVNLLRMLSVDVGAVETQFNYDLFPDVQSVDTAAMEFSDFDPITSAPTTLWATMRNPDVLAKISLPLDLATSPRVRKIIPLPTTPGELVVIPRAGKGDLVAVTSGVVGAVVVYDDQVGQVVANIERVGDSPYGLKLYETTPTAARLVAGVFAGCSVALVEVPLDNPAASALRARIGGCEQ
jgi:hypothetical protein